MPTEKYAHGPEILEHCQRIGNQYGLYDKRPVPHRGHRPRVGRRPPPLDRPHQPGRRVHRAVRRHGHRPAARPEAAGHPRHRVVRGPLVPHQPLGLRLHRRRPGGRADGAPGRQAGRHHRHRRHRRCSASPTSPGPAAELYVFQRTPSSVDVRDNRPTDPEWFAEIATPGWQQRWLENFTANQTGGQVDEDLVMDGWTDLARRIRGRDHGAAAATSSRPENMMAAFEDSDFEKMEEIRARVDAIVEDPETAQALKAWYRQLCKRPCFHDEYLQAFNEPGTHLVDTDGKGVERITATGVVVGRRSSTRSTASSTPRASRSAPSTPGAPASTSTGRDGVKLSEHWADGMRTHARHPRARLPQRCSSSSRPRAPT